MSKLLFLRVELWAFYAQFGGKVKKETLQVNLFLRKSEKKSIFLLYYMFFQKKETFVLRKLLCKHTFFETGFYFLTR